MAIEAFKRSMLWHVNSYKNGSAFYNKETNISNLLLGSIDLQQSEKNEINLILMINDFIAADLF